MNSQDIILPKTEEIQIADRSYKIGTLSLKQILDLSRWFVQIAPQIKESVMSADTNIGALLNIVQAVDEKDSVGLFCIFLKELDRKFVEDNVTGNGVIASQILRVICEANDFGKLLENFIQTVAMIKKTMPKDAKALMASLPS
jgi:hypothetical protein